MLNIYRLIADGTHLLAILYLIFKIWRRRSCAGVSGKSQVLLLVVFISRYLDMFLNFISYYNTGGKMLFIGLTAFTVFLIFKTFKSTYNSKQDAFHAEILLIGAAVLAYFVHNESSFLEVMWTFSIYLEAVAMLPQFSMILRAGEMEMFMYHYLFAYGCYRGYYIFNWVYRYSYEGFYDNVAFWSGWLQTIFYCYFLYSTRFLKMQARAQSLEQNKKKEEELEKIAVLIDGLNSEAGPVTESTVDTELTVNDGSDVGNTTVPVTPPVPGTDAQAETSPNTEHSNDGSDGGNTATVPGTEAQAEISPNNEHRKDGSDLDSGNTTTVPMTPPVPGTDAQAETSPNTEHRDNGTGIEN